MSNLQLHDDYRFSHECRLSITGAGGRYQDLQMQVREGALWLAATPVD